ncbi:MAG: hypothetical protein JWM56_1433 [Candidatus Peribacteria bacterium]|nr:hypothetical protein [Candidatus Peribacteria bacterium]
MNLSQTIHGISFTNPTVLAAGMMGITASGWKDVARHGAGGITTKSMWIKEHKGHPNPVVISTPYWSINAVGLPYAGFDVAKEEVGSYMKDHPVPLIANIVAESVEAFAETAAKMVTLKPDFLEVNISCPNVEDEFGRPFACSPSDAAAVTRAVKAVSGTIPVFIKLSPNVDNIKVIAAACAEAGANGITAINTVGPGMAIDLRSRLPILANKVGGMSGRGIKPLAVRCVADIYAATEGKLPIIGLGGIATGEDALEMMMAGASLVGIGTAIWERGLDVFRDVSKEMQMWCTTEGVGEISELVGSMHKEVLISTKH